MPPTNAAAASPAADPAPRLIVDARTVDGARPDEPPLDRPLLGLPLLRRMALAARRGGFGDIIVLTGAPREAQAAAALTDIDRTSIETDLASIGPHALTTAVVPADLLAETRWLAELAATAVDTPTRARGVGGLCLVPPGAHPSVVLADADTKAGEITLSMAPFRLAGPDDWPAAERRLLSALRKETDGFMARVFARPISLSLSRLLSQTAVTPNQMTVVSLLVGLAAAPFFLSAEPLWQSAGAFLFILHSVVDGCDGELARLNFTESRLGGLLDFWSDNVVHTAVFACMAVGWAEAESARWPLWLGMLAVVGTAGSAFAVYVLTLRRGGGAGPVYTSVAAGSASALTGLLDALSRRDFIYLVFVLALFGKAAWFLAAAAVGAPVFFVLVLIAAWRARRPAPTASG